MAGETAIKLPPTSYPPTQGYITSPGMYSSMYTGGTGSISTSTGQVQTGAAGPTAVYCPPSPSYSMDAGTQSGGSSPMQLGVSPAPVPLTPIQAMKSNYLLMGAVALGAYYLFFNKRGR